MEEDWKKKIITPRVGIAGIVESPGREYVLVIERKYPPKGKAFPGGFMELGETVEETIVREVKEETGIDANIIDVLNICSKPEFDPRFHIVAVHIIMRANEFSEPCGMDDAKDAFWMKYDSNEFYDEFNLVSKLTLEDYREWRKNERRLSKLR